MDKLATLLACLPPSDYKNIFTAEVETLRAKVAELEAQLDYYRSLEPVACYDPQERGFYWAKPTKIEAPVTVKVAPIPLYAMEKE